MTAARQPRRPLAERPPEAQNTPAPRPKPAASLIVVRDDGRVLMGKRSDAVRFMPGKFVFPGGRPHRNDGRMAAMGTVAGHSLFGGDAHLRHRLGMAAIRETFEETGLRLAAPGTPPVVKGWRAFAKPGLLPDLGALRFFARAVTPPWLGHRYDTRFFVARAQALQPGTPEPSEELTEVHWLSPAEAMDTNLPIITRFLLEELPDWLNNDQAPALCARVVAGQMRVDRANG